MQDFEKLGVFYLGRETADAGGAEGNLVLYDSKDLTTHAVIVGMTGSGKTGLGIGLLEEAAIDGVPAIAIDPKGDLGNLLLSFPELRPEDFRPWVDEGEAARKGATPDEFAARTAQTWREGLSTWGQDGARIRRFRDAVDLAIYTPGNASGRPLQVLKSLGAPPQALLADSSALRDRIQSTVSGLLGLLGADADPVQSREHILLSTILDDAWRAGRNLDLPGLIREIQKPPFAAVGVFDLETFFPAKDRLGLAMGLNNLVASPGFSAWMEGEPLDVQRLLHTPEGKPRLSVLSIAHLSDAERMFFVTILLGEILVWARAQPGTSSLRAILYMDEIFGYFPPTANPPSKTPMLTLLKQARAYGLGVVLSTQNPVDLDYKGLSNAGTWFIGRLQTARDKERVIEGIEGATAGAEFDRPEMERILAGLGNRVFLMRNVHEDAMAVFETRWTLSYLRGPLTLPQVRSLCAGAAARIAPAGAPPAATPAPAAGASSGAAKPAVPPGTPEYFLKPTKAAGALVYRPMAAGASKLHFVDAGSDVDAWVPFAHLAPLSDDGSGVMWEEATARPEWSAGLDPQPRAGAGFKDLPGAPGPKAVAAWKDSLEDHLHQNVTLDLFAAPSLKMVSAPGETLGDFTVRFTQALRERRDAEVAALRGKYEAKLRTMQDRVARAEDRHEREKSQAGQQVLQAAVSLGATVLGALFSRKAFSVGTVGRAATTMRSAGRIGKEREDAARAAESIEVARQRLAELEEELEREIAALQDRHEPSSARVETIHIRPRKSDIAVGAVGIAWVPWTTAPDGMPEPAF
ncbi:MAG: ATP-binding protein [Verrucomicrobia bacterium A1]|nr:MAG: ATP-binding protein [Verrucomicrobia bacterium A1]